MILRDAGHLVKKRDCPAKSGTVGRSAFSVRLAMCPVERERDPSGCRASGHSIAPGSFVFARCGGYKKAQDFTRAGHRMVQSTLLLSFV